MIRTDKVEIYFNIDRNDLLLSCYHGRNDRFKKAIYRKYTVKMQHNLFQNSN